MLIMHREVNGALCTFTSSMGPMVTPTHFLEVSSSWSLVVSPKLGEAAIGMLSTQGYPNQAAVYMQEGQKPAGLPALL